MRKKYVIGADFGTQSGRVLLVDAQSGRELATAVVPYPDGVIDERLPGTNIELEHDWALQNPDDYLLVFSEGIPKILAEAAVSPADVIGLGIDFTSCTMLPVYHDNRALCQVPEYRANPHSWVKLWKHHAAQDEANKLNAVAAQRGEEWLPRYGGKISSEWLIPKIMQILDEAPEIYAAADCFMEGTDWTVMQLTGERVRNSCTAGYKAIWHKRHGYPAREFFAALDPRLENLVEEKLKGEIRANGTKAGGLLPEMAERIGLLPGTAVAVGNVDAHAVVPACGVVSAGKMVMSMGTSICHLLLGDSEQSVPGMCGVVEDGVIPGYYAYEAGQSAVGDIFEWFVERCVPESYEQEARERGINIHVLLEEKAARLKPGESGLLALDWWNGNRSVLVDTDLSGLLIGADLSTKPEEIYRALIEATAMGTRLIVDTFEEHSVKIDELYACGGLSLKNDMLMQIYSDVCKREIFVAESLQTPALGAAMFAAVAAGKAAGGYDNFEEAAEKMTRIKCSYKPAANSSAVYEKIYAEYRILHDYFGRGENNVMKRLRAIKKSV